MAMADGPVEYQVFQANPEMENLTDLLSWKRFGAAPPKQPQDFAFEPTFGWQGAQPMLRTLASLHADTITELKFCGYQGAPDLYGPGFWTGCILTALKQYHRLESLITSFWLNTDFEAESRDAEIIQYWRNMKSSDSTALVVRDEDELEPGSWGKELRETFAPEAMVRQIVKVLGPSLSERAKSREGGLHIRASFALGDFGGVFDIDLWVGKDAEGEDICLRATEPLENNDPPRRRDKLESRRWF
jgi:hypothetical protein